MMEKVKVWSPERGLRTLKDGVTLEAYQAKYPGARTHVPGTVRATLEYLRLYQRARAAGYPVAFTSDPAWLVQMAINRRSGWPDDPTTTRGSAMPVNGCYPRRAAGDYGYRALCLFARRVNTPRLVVRVQECPKRYRARLKHRFFRED